MSIMFMEGFEQYGDAIGPDRRWSSGFDIEAPGRFNYGRCGRFQGQSVTTTIRSDGAPQTDFAIGIAMRFDNDAISAGNRTIFQFHGNAAQNRQCSVFTKPDGTVGWCRNDDPNSQVKCISAPGVMANGSWDYFEFGLHHDNASDTGSNCYVKKNGIIVAQATGVNLRDNGNYTPDTIRWQFNYRTYVDDIYVVDTFASLGEQRVVTLAPNADTADKDFTASSGTDNFAMVDELPFNTTDYVSSATPGALDLYDLQNLPFTPASVSAVQAHMLLTKDDAAERTARIVLKSGGTVSNGPTVGVPGSFGYFRGPVLDVDPNTSAAWTAAAVNALQAGCEVVS